MKLWSRSFVTNLVSTFAFWFNVDFLLLVLPLYLRDIGFEASIIGLVYGVAAPAAIAARLLFGRMIDRHGGQAFMILGGLAWAVSTVGMIFSSSLVNFIILRLLQGAGLGVFTTAALAHVTDSTPSTRQDTALGWWSAATPTMATLAPVIAAFSVQRFGFTPALIIAATGGGIAVLASGLLPAQHKDNSQKSLDTKPYVQAALLPGLFGGAVALASGSFAAFAPLIAADKGIENVGLLLTLSALGSISVRFVAGPLAEKKGQAWVIVPGLGLAACALVLLGTAKPDIFLFISPFIFGVGTGAAMPGLLSWAVDRAGEQERATAGGTFYALFEVGLFAGPPLLGNAIESFGFAAFMLPAAFLITALVAYVFWSRPHTSSEVR